MSEPFIAEIILFGGNFAPRGWALCQGQLLSIAQNTALFSILGTTYGGNGTTTFALPDLRGRVPVGTGTGPGLPNVDLGEVSGERNHTLIVTEIPQHNHTTVTTSDRGTTDRPGSGVLLARGNALAAPSSPVALAPQSIGFTGGSQPHNNMQPYLGMNYIIALEGIFPSRN